MATYDFYTQARFADHVLGRATDIQGAGSLLRYLSNHGIRVTVDDNKRVRFCGVDDENADLSSVAQQKIVDWENSTMCLGYWNLYDLFKLIVEEQVPDQLRSTFTFAVSDIQRDLSRALQERSSDTHGTNRYRRYVSGQDWTRNPSCTKFLLAHSGPRSPFFVNAHK